MASAAKTAAATLLLVGLLLVGLGAFLPSGEAWSERGTIRDTETYSVFTYDFARTNGETTIKDPTAKGWTDDSLATGAGTNSLVAATFTAVGALLFAIVGTILAFPDRTTRLGGILAIVGAAAVGVVAILMIVGMRARVEQVYGFAGALTPLAGIFLLGFGFLLLLVGGALCLTINPAPRADTWESYPAHVEAQQAASGVRTLVCPECGTRSTAKRGVVPTCGSCGFHKHDAHAAHAHDAWATPA